MKKTLSIIASLVLAANSLQADSFDITDALQSGSFSGDIMVYHESIDATPNAGFSMGSLGFAYESAKFRGFGLNLGFRANNEFDERNDGDYSDGGEPRVLLHTANISYEGDGFSAIVGRQELDLEWATDFHEAVVGVFTPLTDLTIIAGHTIRLGVADQDAPLERFSKINGNDGTQLLDISYTGIEDTLLKAYMYNANDVATWYGLKGEWDSEMFGFTLHGAQSSEDAAGAADGAIYHIEGRLNVAGISLSGGYIDTDKDAGIGSMDAIGESINPLEEGNQVYEADARTYYVGAGYEISSISLGAMYAQTKYGQDKESEINFSADYAFNDNLSFGGIVADVDAQNSTEDYTKFAINATYAF
jgi:hypothetical protein